VAFVLSVTNATTEHVELTFRNGQTTDVVVRAIDAVEGGVDDPVWRFGDGRAFTEALRAETLAPGEKAREEMVWEDPVPDPTSRSRRFRRTARPSTRKTSSTSRRSLPAGTLL